jgi:DNA adenine methylase
MPYVAATLMENELEPDLFVEPFAGGASVALELLATGRVKTIGLAERDPYVASFWRTVFFDSDWLCRQVEQVEVTIETWKRMKTTHFRSTRGQALACLFLNRTSFNGTLHDRAGPIGGQRQASNYTLDCRFPRHRLVRRIRGGHVRDADVYRVVAIVGCAD